MSSRAMRTHFHCSVSSSTSHPAVLPDCIYSKCSAAREESSLCMKLFLNLLSHTGASYVSNAMQHCTFARTRNSMALSGVASAC